MAADSNGKRIDLAQGVVPVASIVTFVAATWWLSGRLSSIDLQIANVNNELQNIKAAVTDRWTMTQMESCALRAEKMNPGWTSPEIRRP